MSATRACFAELMGGGVIGASLSGFREGLFFALFSRYASEAWFMIGVGGASWLWRFRFWSRPRLLVDLKSGTHYWRFLTTDLLL